MKLFYMVGKGRAKIITAMAVYQQKSPHNKAGANPGLSSKNFTKPVNGFCGAKLLKVSEVNERLFKI
jgi:hypothetical protein